MSQNEENYEAEQAYLREKNKKTVLRTGQYRVIVQIDTASDELYLDTHRIDKWASESATDYGMDRDNITDEDICEMVVALISADLDYEGISE